MSTNFWDVKPPEDDEKAKKHDGVELAETPDIEQSDKIHFPNPLKIQIDGQERDFFIENQAKLSSELINAIRSSNEFWIVDIDSYRNAFFQMHIESGLIEYWTDGAMQSQQTGDIDDALKHLESILTTGSFSQIAKVELDDNPISSSTEIVPTQQRIDAMQQIDVAQLESVETPEIHKFDNNIENFFVGSILISMVFFVSNFALAGGILPFIFSSIAAILLLIRIYSIRTKILYFKNQQTYVWYQGNSVLFIYVKEMTDKLLTWTTTSTSTDSDGNTTTTKLRHFRIIDANGGELFSGLGAGGKSGRGRDELITLLGLETMAKNRYKPPSTEHSVTGNTRRDLDNKENMQTAMKGIFALILVPILFVGTIAIFIIVTAFMPHGYGTYYEDYEMPNRWCDYSVNYPVTVPLTVVGETSMDGYEHNREDGTYSDATLVTNGGICTYRYRTGDSRAFEFVYELQEVSDIDGISMLIMPHPGGQFVGYSGLEVYTMTDNSSEWVLQIESPYMHGDYERYASYENYRAEFGSIGVWNRHAFDSTVENVSVVKIVTGNADQLGDRSVSFSGLRVDAAGDYDYPDYLICSGEWDGLFENSTSDMVVWDPDGC